MQYVEADYIADRGYIETAGLPQACYLPKKQIEFFIMGHVPKRVACKPSKLAGEAIRRRRRLRRSPSGARRLGEGD